MKNLKSALASLMLIASASTALAADATKVQVLEASARQETQLLSLTGTIEAKQHAALAPLQAGLIAQLEVEVGDIVEKGQKLLVLDSKLAQLAVKQAEAMKSAAQAEVREAERLYEEVIVLSKKQLVAETLLGERISGLEIAKAKLGEASAQLASQQELLSRHTLYAPFSGVIAERQVDLGEWVTQQTPVLTLVEQKGKRLNVKIPQEYFVALNQQKTTPVKVTPDFTRGSAFDAQLDTLVAVASNNSRTVTGLINLPDQAEFVVGMSARADISLSASNQLLVWLPKSAVKQHPDGGRSVFTVINNKANRLLVKVVETNGEQVAIEAISTNEPFIVSGVELLKDGDLVTIEKRVGAL